jgi:hypothetical protein
MIKVAFIKDNGEISNIQEPSSDFDYVDGQVYGGLTAKVLDNSINPIEFITKIWNGSEFVDRPLKPEGDFWDWKNGAWVRLESEFWTYLRRERDKKLKGCDWTQLPDAPLTEQQKTEWQTYRQALRDVPLNNSNVTSLDEVVWPTPPTV